MAKYDKIIAGLVIQLPRGGTGVIIQATNIGKGWYRAVVICYDGDVMLCKIKLQENGEDIDTKDVHYYDTRRAAKTLQNNDIKE